jgi:hypothetical protein
MKNLLLVLAFAGCIFSSSCKKDSKSEPFKFLTGPVWISDSLLVNGIDASGIGGILENFKGEAKFNEDGTGYFGSYNGTWRFASAETQIVIQADSLTLPLTAKIVELTSLSLKVTTSYPNILNPAIPINIRMTFKAK